MFRPLVFLVAGALLLGACRHKSVEQKLLDDVHPAISWVSTLQFAGERWLANSVPTSFMRASTGAARKSLQKATKSIAESEAKKELRDAILQQIEISDAAAADVKRAVEANDRRLAAESVRRFAAAHAALERIQQQASR